MSKYTFQVEKTIYPFGPKDPVEEKFEIVIEARTLEAAGIRASNIGKELGLMLVYHG